MKEANKMCENITKTDGSFTTEELKQKIRDQEIYIVGLKYQIQQLEYKLENFLSIQRQKCCECCQKAVIELADKEFELYTLKEKIGALIK